MFDLSGKTALVTGASGRNRRRDRRGPACPGATVALSGTQAPGAGGAGREAGRAHRDRCRPISPIPAACEKLITDAEAALGQVDILVNNAGLTRDTIWRCACSDEDWQTVLDVNLTAGFRLARACLRGMMRRRWGRIIGISSVVGHTGNPGQANYAAAKAGMIGMSKALAAEVASRNITVNVVSPGFIETADDRRR